MRNLFFACAIVCLASVCGATITVSGSLKDPNTSVVGSNVFVRMYLRGCGGNPPVVSGTALLAPNGGNTWYQDFTPNASTGAVSGTLYSSAEITCGSQTSVIWYGMVVYRNGRPGPEWAIDASQNININAPVLLSPGATVQSGSSFTQSYVCIESVAATTWTCTHNFGDSSVLVFAYDSSNKLIWPDSTTLTDANTVTLSFTVAQAGKAIIMRAGTLTVASGLQNVVVSNPTTNQTIAGGYGLTNSGPLTSKFLNSVPYAEQFGASDIGGDINSADTGCVANIDVVCPISVSPQPGTVLNFTAPILLNTPGRVHLLDFSGAYLNYTPTTATTAFTPDWIPAGGSGYIVAHGIRNLTLRNNGCVTNGGCGSLATGFTFGGTNSGMQNGYTFGLRVQGFGTGMTYPNTGSTSWGNDHFHCSLAHNTTGVSFPTGIEATNFFGCKFAVNGTGISNPNTSDISDFGGSMDSNTVAGYSGFGNYFAFGKHFENLGSTTLNYINSTNGVVSLYGGLFLDDQNSGTVSSMFTTSGGLIHISGASIFSGGRTITNLFNVSGAGHVTGDYATLSPSFITNPCANTTLCTLQINTSTGTTEWGDRTFVGDQSFQAGTGTVLGPLHFKNAAGTNLWDVGNKDSGGASTDDFVIASTSSTGFGQNMVGRVLSSTGFWTNFRYDTAGTNNVFKINGVQVSDITGTGKVVLQTSPTLTTPNLSGLTNGTGLQLFNTATTCTTSATAGATCTTAAITLPVAYSDTNYRAYCTGLGPTNVPFVMTVAKSNTTFTITIGAVTAAAATYSSYDCQVGHN